MTQPVKRKRVPVHGVLLLDKPVGMSSAQALAKAKWLLNAQKAGHTGTLDPFATGLLPLCFGEATKFAQDLLDADKTYETVVHLGITTETGDTEGTILTQQIVDVTVAQIESVLDQFRGPISQVPPMHSALKRDGKPLYEKHAMSLSTNSTCWRTTRRYCGYASLVAKGLTFGYWERILALHWVVAHICLRCAGQ